MRRVVFFGKNPPAGYDVIPLVEQLQKYGDVILFGSFSRGQPANDLDFLVVTDAEEIDIDNFGIKVDLKICTRAKLDKCLKLRDHVYKTAWEKGIHYSK